MKRELTSVLENGRGLCRCCSMDVSSRSMQSAEGREHVHTVSSSCEEMVSDGEAPAVTPQIRKHLQAVVAWPFPLPLCVGDKLLFCFVQF